MVFAAQDSAARKGQGLRAASYPVRHTVNKKRPQARRKSPGPRTFWPSTSPEPKNSAVATFAYGCRCSTRVAMSGQNSRNTLVSESLPSAHPYLVASAEAVRLPLG
jgi:hypothetical protein